MKIKELIKNDVGFQYVVDNLELMSAAGRRKALNSEFSADADLLRTEWRRLAKAIAAGLTSSGGKVKSISVDSRLSKLLRTIPPT